MGKGNPHLMAAPSLTDDFTLAIELADIADRITGERFRAHDLRVSSKPDHSYVTDADKAVERAIRDVLQQRRPEDGILGEEYGTNGNPQRQWIIDPIDGTANYLRGLPVWATLIALAVEAVPLVGVVSAPGLGCRWWAQRGHGAWLTEGGGTPRQLRVSPVVTLAHASMSFQSIRQWDDAGYLEQLIRLTRTVWRDRAYGDMWSYMMLAEGLIDVVAEFGVKPYDLAALIPLIEEAGGRFTSVTGEPGPWHGNAVASNGLLHETVLDALRR
jgi:histidinol-phosphatase